MVEFIETDAEQYAKLAQEDRRHVMVHRESDGTLTCEIDGTEFHTDNAWQLGSRVEQQGYYGVSFWLDTVFSEPGVMLAKEPTHD